MNPISILLLLLTTNLSPSGNSCIQCHLAIDDRPVIEFQNSLHFRAGVTCEGCHGGDPAIEDETSMDSQYGFIGKPEEKELPRMCGGCHAKGGQFLKAETMPNCTSCHSSHIVKRAGIHMVNRGGAFSFVLLAIASLLSFSIGFITRVRHYRKGRKGTREDPLWKRIFLAKVDIFTNRKIFSNDPYAGVFHSLILWGFTLLFLGNIVVWLDKLLFHYFIPKAEFLHSGAYKAFSIVTDLGALFAGLGILLLIVRRVFLQPLRLQYPDVGDPSPSRLSLGDWVFVLLIFIVAFGGLFLEGMRIRLHSEDLKTYSFAGLFSANILHSLGLSERSALDLYDPFWWIHLSSAFLFVGYIPFSKASHMILDFFSILLHDEKGGKRLPPILEGKSSGYKIGSDFTRKELLQIDACTRCGRCYEVCPAALSGFPLSPRRLVLDLRKSVRDTDGGRVIPGEWIGGDTLWSCMTCYACMEICPIGIEHIPMIVNLRRTLVEEGKVDERVKDTLMNFTRYGNSFGQSDRGRAKWTQGLDFKIRDGRREPVDTLWVVGDYASYDPRLQEVTRLVARIFAKAGLDFGILYEGERNSGNDVRRIGEEGLFEMLREKNLKTMENSKFKRIVTTDPHTLNTLKNEYPFGSNGVRILHYTELLDQWIQEGKLPIRKKSNRRVTYHDPCYLGRYNGVYEPPRRVLKALGVELVEMERNRLRTYCCGAGGGRVWMEKPAGAKERPSENRIREAVSLPDCHLLVVACPKDYTMFQDAVKTTGNEEKIAIMDLSELVWETMGEGEKEG